MATILIAEDEQAIRRMIERVLEEAGYTVLVAESAQEAKAKSDPFVGAIVLLVTNHMLRDGLGRDVADYITRRRPAIRVLQISGHPHQELKAERRQRQRRPSSPVQFAQRIPRNAERLVGNNSPQ